MAYVLFFGALFLVICHPFLAIGLCILFSIPYWFCKMLDSDETKFEKRKKVNRYGCRFNQ